MQLEQLRQQFIELTGRYDLLEVAQYSEEIKADFFINSGIRVLDRKVTSENIQVSAATFHVPPDVSTVQIPRCWQLWEVWGLPMDGSGTRIRLTEKKEHGYFQQFFHRHPIQSFSRSGQFPTHYTLNTSRNEQQLKNLQAMDLNVPANYVHTGEWNGWVMSLTLFPQRHVECVIEVHGKFYSPELKKDSDSNIWTQQHPALVIKAAAHVLEVFYRNTEGANDWLNSIMDELLDIEKMEVETSSRRYSVMEG